jgi:hypothetical protein
VSAPTNHYFPFEEWLFPQIGSPDNQLPSTYTAGSWYPWHHPGPICDVEAGESYFLKQKIEVDC